MQLIDRMIDRLNLTSDFINPLKYLIYIPYFTIPANLWIQI